MNHPVFGCRFICTVYLQLVEDDSVDCPCRSFVEREKRSLEKKTEQKMV